VNYRRVLSAFFGFCIRRGHLPNGSDELDRLAKIKLKRTGGVAVFTAAELGKLLANAPEDFRPCLALQAFCGLRSSEVERLRWDDVHFAEGHVEIGADRAKTASRRIVSLCAAANQWLAPFKDSAGKVWNRGHQAFYHLQQDTAEAAGVKWKANAPRHSWISYRLAEIQDPAKVAFEAGNSAAMVHRHYKALVTPKAAKQWFGVKPAKPANVAVLKVA
jgi:integrase